MMNEQQIHGIYIPVIAPFTNDNKLDIDSYRKYITHLANHDIQGLVVNGTTGESPTVSWDEVKQMVQATKEILTSLNKTVPVVVGTGTNDTYSTIQRTEMAAELGADAALVVTPYYNRPTQEGILAHFSSVSRTGLPILVYEIPARTGSRMTLDTVRKVMDLDGVIGLKDSSGGLDLLLALSQYEMKPVLCGEDAYFHAMLCQGAAGGMMASASIHTQRFVEVYQRFASGDILGSRDSFKQLEPLIDHVFTEPAPALIKWWLAQQQLISTAQLRLPLTAATENGKQKLTDTLMNMVVHS
ncbi:4-hydroxy-tetrahydrodipicolinate synthase [Paenibacillus pabuli]|uniref:4-hydroxy-tetrahydrodipicolinate synthase n=1 Tax=Paenibacillus pabuli TaxID=1472 RepID=UPI000781EC15|nr:4-hydroxy-tetrahydrodipicolinate synthase [Paenibacillus pabuli]MEC0125160.1 4-hydroxy-tetrahydrodipicolinate synthase [Paenibacillus pabuli]